MRFYQKERWYNPYFVMLNGEEYELAEICSFTESGVTHTTNRGWFGSCGNNNAGIIDLDTKKPLVRKIKTQFNKAEPFIVKMGESFIQGKKRYALYIPESDLKLSEPELYKEASMIRQTTKSLINDNICFDETKKFLDDEYYQLIGQYEITLKLLEPYLLTELIKKPEDFKKIISNVKKLFQKLVDSKEYVKNYMVDDYIKERGDN